jgi:hypothetical protein
VLALAILRAFGVTLSINLFLFALDLLHDYFFDVAEGCFLE